jgi:hypothetical protein
MATAGRLSDTRPHRGAHGGCSQVDVYGRRPLLLLGVGGIVVALAVIGLTFHLGFDSDAGTMRSMQWGQVTVVGMLVLVSAYQVKT